MVLTMKNPQHVGLFEISHGFGEDLGYLSAVWWAHQDSNLGPSDYESDALTN